MSNVNNWGQAINKIGYGTVYNESWVGEYVFLTIVGDANDLESRVAADNGTMEAHGSMVLTMQKSLR